MSRVQVRPTAKTRQRRRRRRLFTLLTYTAVVFGLAWYFDSMGTTTIIFVRHTDVDRPAVLDDQPLNARGAERAELLADFLGEVDVVAGPDAIYVSPLAQTQQTAAPLAKRHGIEPEVADPYDVVGFMSAVLREHKREIVLIVTHADAIAPLVEELHGSKNLAEIGPDDYRNVYIVTIPTYGKVKTVQLPYALGFDPVPTNGLRSNSPFSSSSG
jgi:broad specificity phosphatase PhoE